MFRSFVFGIVLTLILAAVGLYLAVTHAVIPAGADSGPIAFERWAAGRSLGATLARSAPKEPNPVALTDENLIAGVQLFAQHCAICHGTAAGDASTTPLARGEYPQPPQLASHGIEDDPEGETFWKIAHGIRWTGMPSWKETLNDQQMWTLALFLKHMDKLPPAAQQVWQQVHN